MVSLDYYNMFYYVAQYKSFTGAAKALNNNQPNITRCMNILEKSLGVKLLNRSNRGVTLTEAGMQLYQHVAVAHDQIMLGEAELNLEDTTETGMIAIGASELALRLYLVDTMEEYKTIHGGVKLKVQNNTTLQAIEATEKQIVDFAVVTSSFDVKTPFASFPLKYFDEILIAGPKYKDLASNTQDLKDLTDIPLISMGQDTCTYELYNKFYHDNNLPFRPDIEVAASDQIPLMVKHNLGIGFYPEELCREAIAAGKLFRVPLAQREPHRSVDLVFDPGREFSESAIAMLRMMQRLINEKTKQVRKEETK